MNLGNTFMTNPGSAPRRPLDEDIREPIAPTADWPLADGDAVIDDAVNDDAVNAAAPGDPAAGSDPGERPAVVRDEFDPTLSFRDAKERAVGLWERWYVAELLRHTRGNLSEAARVAHSDRSHLRKLVRKHLR
jgi:hypothetical protein